MIIEHNILFQLIHKKAILVFFQNSLLVFRLLRCPMLCILQLHINNLFLGWPETTFGK